MLLYSVASVEGGSGSFVHSARLRQCFPTTFRVEVSATNSLQFLVSFLALLIHLQHFLSKKKR